MHRTTGARGRTGPGVGLFALASLISAPGPADAKQSQPATDATAAEAEADEQTSGAQSAALEERIRQLEASLAEIQEARDAEELEKLRQSAETEAATAPDESGSLEERTYVTASRSLQMLNPEISVSGDFVAQLVADPELKFYASEDDRSQVPLLRALDLHLQSSLDPFSFTKMAIGIEEEGAGVEELYITWTGIIPRATITAGLFRQQLGVVNRWHEHDLDQVDYPLALTEFLGEEGLTQSGVSISWLVPQLLPMTNELTLQVTNGQSEVLFGGDFFSVPTALAHIKSYVDVTEDIYVELGLSGMWGFNNRRGFFDPGMGALLNEPWRSTWVGGADLTLVWEPLQQARYHSLTWRSEGLWVSRENPEGEPRGYRHGWGAYSYLQYQLAEVWFLGLRADAVQPLGGLDNQLLWAVSPYVTFWQSEFVYLRLQAQHGQRVADTADTRVMLQLDWAAGPHKHEKY